MGLPEGVQIVSFFQNDPEATAKNLQAWKKVCERDDIIGGDLETHEDDVVFRGPIDHISIRDGQVIVRSPWVAKLENYKWVKHRGSGELPIDPQFAGAPNDIGNGRIQFNIIGLGIGVIFPKGGSKLCSHKVKGL